MELLEFSKRNVKIWLHFRLKNDVKESLIQYDRNQALVNLLYEKSSKLSLFVTLFVPSPASFFSILYIANL